VKQEKKYYVVMVIIMCIAYFVVGHYNLFNITGFLICLFTYIIFNIIWIFYLKSNKNEGQSSIE
jgi:hypothetical protein